MSRREDGRLVDDVQEVGRNAGIYLFPTHPHTVNIYLNSGANTNAPSFSSTCLISNLET